MRRGIINIQVDDRGNINVNYNGDLSPAEVTYACEHTIKRVMESGITQINLQSIKDLRRTLQPLP